MNRLIPSLILLLLLPVSSAIAVDIPSASGIKILVADDPESCLSLESFAVTDSGYMLVDGRNNMARVKFIDETGSVLKTGVPTIPLPDAASLPADILPTPWGLDRIALSSDSIWAVPSTWSGAIAERFDFETGDFIERIPDPGLRVNGMITGPGGDVWAVGRRILVNVSSGTLESINLTGSVLHIDTAVGHPLGFLIYEQPDLLLVDSNKIIQWRISLDGILDNFVSPLDIATGPDGSIAIGAVLCDLSVPEDRDEYYNIREGCFMNDDEETLFFLEDTLREKLSVGYALIMMDPDGTVTAVKEMVTPPTAVSIDSTGRYHVLSQESDGWGIYIWDPRLDREIEVMHIPMGIPAMIAPHRLASGRDGSLYWDDIISDPVSESWGIARLPMSSGSGLFSLGSGTESDSKSAPIEWVFREPLMDFIRRLTSLAVTDDGDIWFGVTEFPLVIPGDGDTGSTVPEDLTEQAPYSNFFRRYDRAGNRLLDLNIESMTGVECFVSDIISGPDGTAAALGATDTSSPFGGIDNNGTWTPYPGYLNDRVIAHARIGRVPDKIVAWMLVGEDFSLVNRWVFMNEDFSGPTENETLGILGCRLLATDNVNGKIYVTIDDGEIFRLNAENLHLDGIWTNRLMSGAPGHTLDDAVVTSDGLAVLDREHRTVLLFTPDAFTEPQISTDLDVDEAVGYVRSAFLDFKTLYGAYPDPSPHLLYDILPFNEYEKVKRAFIGGRIYNYSATEMGYSFTVWSASADQPVLHCTESDTAEYY